MENIKRGLLIIISGPSGVGKGTIRKEIMDDETLNLAYSVSMTTRKIRDGEIDGKDYYFVSNEEFDRNIKEDNLLEWAEFVGNKYGTLKSEIERLRNLGKNVLLEIEVNGTKQVLQKCQGDDVLLIFLIPPSLEELENRIRARSTESEEAIQKRLAKAEKELKMQGDYKYVVLNDDRHRAANEIKTIIRQNIVKN